MREIGSILGLKVVSILEGKSLGTITEVVIDLTVGKMIGVIVGRGPAEKGIRAADIQALGADAVLVGTTQVAEHLSAMPKLIEHRRPAQQRPPEVITSEGQRLGQLDSVYIDPQTMKVKRFEVSGGAWQDLTEGVISLPIVKGIVHGPDVVIMPAKGLSKSAGKGGLRASLGQLADSAQTGYQRGAQRAEGLYQQGSKTLRHGMATARQHMHKLAEEIKEETTAELPAEDEPSPEEPEQEQSQH